MPVSEDEVICAFLKSSAGNLPESVRLKLSEATDGDAYGQKLIRREICRSLGMLDYFKTRYWYRTSLTPRQLALVHLGQESSNNFSKYFSQGTYKPRIAAENMRTCSDLCPKRAGHRERVVRFSESIELEDLQDVILCASNFTINRKLKIFDGNHRVIAFVLKHGRLIPFRCIVGFSKPRYFGLLQRALLGFEFFTETRDAVKFAARMNARRIRSLSVGGMNYQPLLEDARAMMLLSSSNDSKVDAPSRMRRRSERLCADRAKLLRDDMRSILGDLRGATLLDIGCNVGFFCHFFSSLGMRATGVENGQHNRHQRFSLSNSVCTARKMNQRYNMDCEFIEDDAREWIVHQADRFDVVFLLSVLHHFFLGYPVGDYEWDPLEEARRFMTDIARITDKILYIEYEDVESSISVRELIDFMRSQRLFKKVDLIDYSGDFGRPIIRCSKI